jgi:hypothetical protein
MFVRRKCMKQTEVKTRRFYAALAAAVIAAALGACGEGWNNQEPSPQASETGASDIAYNTGDMVTVKVRVRMPQQSQSGARSLDPAAVRWFANMYEVIFRKVANPSGLSKDLYYRGVDASYLGYINVAVPVGTEYEVLLIAGIDRTLVGVGYRGKNNSPADIDAGKGPVNIEAGKVNEVVIEVTPLTPQWDTGKSEITDNNGNDFEFSASLEKFATDFSINERFVQVGPDTGVNNNEQNENDDIKTSDTFGMVFDISDYKPLALADVNTTSNNTTTLTLVEAPTVELWPRYASDTWLISPPYITLKQKTGTNCLVQETVGGTSGDATYVKYTNTNGDGGFPSTLRLAFECTGLPNKNTDGLLRFELKYKAFGTSYSQGMTWTIRNGRYNYADADTSNGSTTGSADAGSYILVKIGSGTPGSKTGEETKVGVGGGN